MKRRAAKAKPAEKRRQAVADPAFVPEPRERWFAFAAIPVFWLGLAGPLYTLPLFKRGYWELAEPLVIASFAAAGLAALLLAIWHLAGGRSARPALQLALPAFLLGAWLFFSGPDGFSLADWRLRLLGVAQSGYGALWFCALGLWLLLADLLHRNALAWRLALWAALLALAGMAGVLIADRVLQRSTVFNVLAYYGWPGLMLPAIALGLPPLRSAARRFQGGFLPILAGRPEMPFALLLALLLLVLCKAITLLAAGIIGLVLALALTLPMRWPVLKGLQQRPALHWLLLVSAALAPLILVSLPELTQYVQSLESRRLVWRMVWSMLNEQPLYWLVGQGAGTTPDMMMRQLAMAGHPLWDLDGWDLLTGDYFHVHNWLMQALRDGGLPAVALMGWLLLRPVWLARPERRGAALGLGVAYLLGLGLWFELIFVLPYLALAWLALVLPAAGEPVSTDSPSASRLRFAMPAMLLLLAGCFGWSAHVLERFARQFDAQIGWMYEPGEVRRSGPAQMAGPRLPPPPYPEDPRRQDVVMADMMMGLNSLFITRYGADQPPAAHERHVQRLQWQVRIIGDHLASARSPRFAFFASQMFSNVMLLPKLEILRPILLPHLPLWRQTIERGLQLAPKRPDIALEYLNWTIQNGRRDETLSVARLLRQRNPDDPIGLYFEGGALVLREDQASKQQGIALLRRALAAGVELYFPVDAAVKQSIGLH